MTEMEIREEIKHLKNEMRYCDTAEEEIRLIIRVEELEKQLNQPK